MKQLNAPALALALAFAATAVAPALADELKIPDAVYPTVPTHAAAAEGFAPAGWRVETKVAGDLNGDGLPDLVLVLREQNAKNVVDNRGNLGPDTLDTNPRILAVAFARKDGGYDLAAQNHTLIPRTVWPNLEDYLSEEGGVTIKKGVLQVTLHNFSSAGSWTAGHVTYGFAWRSGRLTPIGWDSTMVQRNSGEIEIVSANFLTAKVKHATGRIDNDKSKIRWTRLKRPAPRTLDAIGDGMDFDPEAAASPPS